MPKKSISNANKSLKPTTAQASSTIQTSLEIQTPTSQPCPIDLVSIATTLNEIAQAFLDYNKTPPSNWHNSVWQVLDQAIQTLQSARDNFSKPYPTASEKPARFFYCLENDASLTCQIHKYKEAGYKRDEFNDEIRCFHLPASAVQREYELLHRYRQDNLFELILYVCNNLQDITKLIEQLTKDTNTSTNELHLIRGSLLCPLELLRKSCSLLLDYKLLYSTIS